MKIKVIEVGSTLIDADEEYQVPAIRAALDGGDVADVIIDYTDSERSNISGDEYAIVCEDNGVLLWHGWLTGLDEGTSPPPQAQAWLGSPADRVALFGKGA
jgi:hypothetical protein